MFGCAYHKTRRMERCYMDSDYQIAKKDVLRGHQDAFMSERSRNVRDDVR